jgi:putative ABC transport system permease protein
MTAPHDDAGAPPEGKLATGRIVTAIVPLLRLALRNVARHRGRTTMTLAAIAFGVTSLILTGGFVRDIYAQLGEALIHSQTGHIELMRNGYYESGTRSPEKYRIEDVAGLERAIATLPQVDDVMARVAFAGLLNNGRTDWAIVGEGVEPDKEARLGSYMRIVAGRQLRDSDREGVLVGGGVAKALGLAPGGRVTLLVNSAEAGMNTIDLEVVGVFQSFSKEFDARAIRITRSAAGDVLGSNGANTLVVGLHDTADTDGVAAALRKRFGAAPYEVWTWQRLNDFYDKTVALYDRQFGVLELIILGMVLLSVANSVNMTVFERLGEFGTMRALGNRSRDVVRLVVLEAGCLGVIGATIGVALGILLALAISAIGIPMPPPPNANLAYTAHVRVVPWVVASAFVVGVVGSLLAALWPARRVAQRDVAVALQANI